MRSAGRKNRLASSRLIGRLAQFIDNEQLGATIVAVATPVGFGLCAAQSLVVSTRDLRAAGLWGGQMPAFSGDGTIDSWSALC